MIKKFTRRADPRPEYLPAINLATIRETAGLE
jgi:[acyl-carrier-protein] S-malonyltransferase